MLILSTSISKSGTEYKEPLFAIRDGILGTGKLLTEGEKFYGRDISIGILGYVEVL